MALRHLLLLLEYRFLSVLAHRYTPPQTLHLHLHLHPNPPPSSYRTIISSIHLNTHIDDSLGHFFLRQTRIIPSSQRIILLRFLLHDNTSLLIARSRIIVVEMTPFRIVSGFSGETLDQPWIRPIERISLYQRYFQSQAYLDRSFSTSDWPFTFFELSCLFRCYSFQFQYTCLHIV